MSMLTEDHLDASWRANPTKTSIVGAVLRRLGPYLVEATVIPTALFYTGLLTLGFVWGIVAAACWTYVSVGRRLARRRPIPGLLLLATLGITLRVIMYLLNDNAFAYFVQPIIRTVATALFFVLSAAIGKPLVARFAADFCAFGTDVRERPAIVSLFRRLTYLWAGAQASIAARTDGLRTAVASGGRLHAYIASV